MVTRKANFMGKTNFYLLSLLHLFISRWRASSWLNQHTAHTFPHAGEPLHALPPFCSWKLVAIKLGKGKAFHLFIYFYFSFLFVLFLFLIPLSETRIELPCKVTADFPFWLVLIHHGKGSYCRFRVMYRRGESGLGSIQCCCSEGLK